MAEGISRVIGRVRTTVGAILLGPQLLAFVPALTLGGYWIAGEAGLVFVAIAIPLLFSLGGLFNQRARPAGPRDPLTGLPYRREVVEAADALFADGPTRAGTTAALAVGIDEYRELVDRYGEDTGTMILRACADRVRGAVRDTDIVGRLDGARFAVVLASGTRSDLESLIQLATRVQKKVQEPITFDGTRLYASVSVGFCAPKQSPALQGEALIGAAEQALNDAASNGTGAIRAFTQDMRRRARSRGALSDELARALEENQIKPWFQPQVSAETGEVTGFEALARWEHPQSGLVPPGEFLPAAEHLGLLGRLGEVMLYQSLNALRAWDAGGCAVPKLSLNFTAEELRNPNIVDKIEWELDRFDIAPQRLSVEVLETVIAQTSNDTIIRNLRGFAELGCLIDLDDFGTGHASIANIKRFSVDRIKIDRSFVTRIDADDEQQNIVAAILTLADRMQLDTLAEGVETPAEEAVLRHLGCAHLQGFGIARPMPYENVQQWLESRRESGAGGALQPARPDPASPGGQPAEQGKTA